MALYGELKHWPNWIETIVKFNHLALVVNSSINILIYACKDEKFLNVLLGRAPPSSCSARVQIEFTQPRVMQSSSSRNLESTFLSTCSLWPD